MTKRVLTWVAACALFALTPAQAVAATLCDDPVYSIETANLEFHGDTITITVQGMAATAGWKNIELRRDPTPDEGDNLVYRLVGCAPEIAAQVLTPVSGRLTGVILPSSVRHITIRARSNSQTLDIGDFRRPAGVN